MGDKMYSYPSDVFNFYCNIGHVDCAWDCISDRSMFVANSARSLIAKYLIKHSNWVLSEDPEDTCHRILDDKNLAAITEKLRSMLSQESSTFPLSAIAVIEITRILLCEDSITGKRLLEESRMFPECLKVLKAGDATVCQRLVDVLCEIVKNTRTWALDWDRLICTEGSSASSILLGSCADLFREGLVSSGLELVAGLGFCQESSSNFPHHWLEVLFRLVELPFELAFSPACHSTENSHNGYHINGSENLHVGLVDGLMAHNEKCESSMRQLQSILSPWIKENHSQTKVICQTLAAAQQLTQQASSTHCSYVLRWIKHSLDLLQNGVDPTQQCIVKLHGNQKVLKASLEFITNFVEVQRTRDVLGSTDPFSVDQLFDELVKRLLQVIENSDSSATVMSSSLKTLGKVFRAARPEFITELFCSDKGNEDTTRKRVRLDSDASCEDVHQVMSIKAANCEKLAFVLFRRLRDSRWEVRDSTLEFIASLLLINNDSVHDFLCGRSIPLIVWNATDDADSYVRASALHVIGSLTCQSQLWVSLLQTGHVNEEGILEKLSSVLEKDDEAFPRRRAMECFTLWIQTRHPMADRILRSDQFSLGDDENASTKTSTTDTSYGEGIQSSNDVQNLSVLSLPEAVKTPPGVGIARSVCHACQDFDWEVKLRGLEFWEAVIGFFTGSKTKKESANTGDAKAFFEEASACCDDSKRECVKTSKIHQLFQVLFTTRALNILSEALNDCDHMVCEKALEILALLQGLGDPERCNVEKCIKTALHFQESLGKGFGLEEFKSILQATDFPALTQSTEAADSAVRSDPVSLIEDILMAATHRDENLLDCY